MGISGLSQLGSNVHSRCLKNCPVPEMNKLDGLINKWSLALISQGDDKMPTSIVLSIRFLAHFIVQSWPQWSIPAAGDHHEFYSFHIDAEHFLCSRG